MTFDQAKYFDRIRIKPRAERKEPARGAETGCQWPGCDSPGSHRAPKGRGQERDYWHFCLDHVREYNQSYNFFSGMSEEAVARYQKDALTGHRPTWRMGANAGVRGRHGAAFDGADDPFAMFTDLDGRTRRRPEPEMHDGEARRVFNAERKALEVMGLGADATLATVKARYKELVKRHHPDANGGDRSTEDRLIEIIKAYNYLKTVTRA